MLLPTEAIKMQVPSHLCAEKIMNRKTSLGKSLLYLLLTIPSDSSAFQGPPIAAITLQMPQGENPQAGSPPLTRLQTCFPANSCTARSAFLPLKGRGRAKPLGT